MSIERYGFFSVCSNTGENCSGVTGNLLVIGGVDLLVVVDIGLLVVVVVVLGVVEDAI